MAIYVATRFFSTLPGSWALPHRGDAVKGGVAKPNFAKVLKMDLRSRLHPLSLAGIGTPTKTLFFCLVRGKQKEP